MKYFSSFSLSVLLVLPHAVAAEQVRVSCSNIADATERLACFDRTFPSDSAAATPQPDVDPITTNSVVPQATVVAPARASDGSAAPATNAQVEQPEAETRRGLFSSKPKVDINSRLKSVRDMDKQKMIFLLENDQIWMQDSPRSLPFSKGQDVSIKSGTIGGYLMSNEEGVSTRVRRIK